MDELLTKQIRNPPFIRLPVKDYITCSKLMKKNNEAVTVLKSCMSEKSSLWTEIDILKKAIYKMKNKWRLEPLFRGTKQVLKCMQILRSEDLLNTISTALDSVLGLDGKTLVPSKQYLEFLLVKIIGVSRLAVQTIEYCAYVQEKLMSKIQIGHVLSYVMSFSAFVSRVWVLSHTLLVQLRTCYQAIYSLHLLAAAAEYTWLPDNVTLPDKFPIDIDSIIQRSSSQEVDISKQESGPTPAAQAPLVSADVPVQSAVEDVGTVIDRSSFQSLMDGSSNRQSQPVQKKTGKKKLKKKSKVLSENLAEAYPGRDQRNSMTAEEGSIDMQSPGPEHPLVTVESTKKRRKKRKASSLVVAPDTPDTESQASRKRSTDVDLILGQKQKRRKIVSDNSSQTEMSHDQGLVPTGKVKKQVKYEKIKGDASQLKNPVEINEYEGNSIKRKKKAKKLKPKNSIGQSSKMSK